MLRAPELAATALRTARADGWETAARHAELLLGELDDRAAATAH
jgi:hypothetical protein